MPTSSSASARACVLKPEASRLLLGWWLALHLLLVVAALAAGRPAGVTPALVGAALLHGLVRRPRAERPLLLYFAPGRWALPAAGGFDLRLTAATRCGPAWVALRFGGGLGVLLLADQLPPEAWRRLRSAVGESLGLAA